jgi:uncharacterized protein
MESFTPWSALVGGAILGLGASLLFLTHGRVFGVSGLYGRVVAGRSGEDRLQPLAVILGLLAAGVVARLVAPGAFDPESVVSLPAAAAAGLLVGFGTRLGGGCTSGHGVCGVSRLSPRSLVATIVFMAVGFATVFVVRHLVGGGGGA